MASPRLCRSGIARQGDCAACRGRIIWRHGEPCPAPEFSRFFFEPIRGRLLVASGLIVWLAGASYCHGYQYFLTGEEHGTWSGSLTWSAIAVVPWFALFEWSKEPQGAEAIRRPATLVALVLGIAGLVDQPRISRRFLHRRRHRPIGLLVMRRLPAIGVSVLLIALTRRAALRRPPNPNTVELGSIAKAIDWVEAADNYIELHVGGRTVMRRMTMRDAEKALAGPGFVRIHRRFLVNRDRIATIDGSNGDRVVKLIDGTELAVGRAFATNLSRIGRASRLA